MPFDIFYLISFSISNLIWSSNVIVFMPITWCPKSPKFSIIFIWFSMIRWCPKTSILRKPSICFILCYSFTWNSICIILFWILFILVSNMYENQQENSINLMEVSPQKEKLERAQALKDCSEALLTPPMALVPPVWCTHACITQDLC